MIPYGRQEVTEADIDAVTEVLRSDWLTQGPKVPEFERAFAEYCGAGHAVAVNSGTSALHVACMALGLQPGGRVWTSPITFLASANCARYCGAQADFVDINLQTFNMDVAELERQLARAAAENTLPDIVIPVHFAGLSCPMAEIRALADCYGFRIIEDACHAVGGRYRDQPVGACPHSDIAVFSLHPVKIVTSGEGGMATTNDPLLAQRMRELRCHGMVRDEARMERQPDGPWYYEQQALGYNYRMTDIHAALGLSQLPRADDYVARRHELAGRYDQALAGVCDTPLGATDDAFSAFHLYIVLLPEQHAGRHREIFEHLRNAGIGVQIHYIPVYRQPYHADAGEPEQWPNAEAYYSRAITLPLYPTLGAAQQDRVVETLKNALA